jgi:hypothetical protein
MGTSEKRKNKVENSQNTADVKNNKNIKGRQSGSSANKTKDLITIIDNFFSRYYYYPGNFTF